MEGYNPKVKRVQIAECPLQTTWEACVVERWKSQEAPLRVLEAGVNGARKRTRKGWERKTKDLGTVE